MSTRYTGVNNLLTPENCTLILIDHQPLQFAGVQNIDGTLLVNNVVGLAKTAKVFGVPTINAFRVRQVANFSIDSRQERISQLYCRCIRAANDILFEHGISRHGEDN